MDISFISSLQLEKSKRITLVGAGGKTSLLYALSREFAEKNQKVLVTTTTRIMEPSDLPGAYLITEEDRSQIAGAFSVSRIAALGIPCPPSSDKLKTESRKWRSPSFSFLKKISDIPDIILCEGDGSRRLPLKIPRQGEPFFFPETDTVVGVIGLSCLYQPASSCLFGREQLPRFSSLLSSLEGPRQLITPEFLLKIALSPAGLCKNIQKQRFCILFNQADLLSPQHLSAVKTIAQIIRDNGIACRIVSFKRRFVYF